MPSLPPLDNKDDSIDAVITNNGNDQSDAKYTIGKDDGYGMGDDSISDDDDDYGIDDESTSCNDDDAMIVNAESTSVLPVTTMSIALMMSLPATTAKCLLKKFWEDSNINTNKSKMKLGPSMSRIHVQQQSLSELWQTDGWHYFEFSKRIISVTVKKNIHCVECII